MTHKLKLLPIASAIYDLQVELYQASLAVDAGQTRSAIIADMDIYRKKLDELLEKLERTFE
jgi:hypothetical protein